MGTTPMPVTVDYEPNGDMRLGASAATPDMILRAGLRALRIAQAMVNDDIDDIDSPELFVEVVVRYM